MSFDLHPRPCPPGPAPGPLFLCGLSSPPPTPGPCKDGGSVSPTSFPAPGTESKHRETLGKRGGSERVGGAREEGRKGAGGLSVTQRQPLESRGALDTLPPRREPPAHSPSVGLCSRPLGACNPLAAPRTAAGSWLHLTPRL